MVVEGTKGHLQMEVELEVELRLLFTSFVLIHISGSGLSYNSIASIRRS